MPNLVELTTNFDDFDTFLEFKKDFRKQIIERGLDEPLSKTADQLRTELLFVVNEKIRATNPATSVQGTETPSNNGLNQPTVSIPKSEDELIKFLTEGKTDPSKYNKAKDYTTLSETNIVFGHGSQGTGAANRVTLRMEIGDDETVQSQYARAKEFFQSSLFALPGPAGGMNYYMNPGIDISQFVKIKCSVFTGDGDTKARKGLSPQERFDRNKTGRGYAEWTLKQDAVEVIRKNYINITEVINFLKQGDTDRAKAIVDLVDKDGKLDTIKQQIDKLESGTNVPSSTQAYNNAVNLINNLKIIKKVNQEDVIYTLVSDFSDFENNEVDFYTQIMNSIRSWGVEQEDYWFNSLVKKAEELIKQYESKE